MTLTSAQEVVSLHLPTSHSMDAIAAAFSGDCGRVFRCDHGGLIHIWIAAKAPTPQQRPTPPNPSEEVSALREGGGCESGSLVTTFKA